MHLFMRNAGATPAHSSSPVCVLVTFVVITFTSNPTCAQSAIRPREAGIACKRVTPRLRHSSGAKANAQLKKTANMRRTRKTKPEGA